MSDAGTWTVTYLLGGPQGGAGAQMPLVVEEGQQLPERISTFDSPDLPDGIFTLLSKDAKSRTAVYMREV